jgi:hypothetical protein
MQCDANNDDDDDGASDVKQQKKILSEEPIQMTKKIHRNFVGFFFE